MQVIIDGWNEEANSKPLIVECCKETSEDIEETSDTVSFPEYHISVKRIDLLNAIAFLGVNQ